MHVLLGILFRHLLTAGGAILIAKGVVDSATVEAVSGAVITIVGTIASVVNKKNTGQL